MRFYASLAAALITYFAYFPVSPCPLPLDQRLAHVAAQMEELEFKEDDKCKQHRLKIKDGSIGLFSGPDCPY